MADDVSKVSGMNADVEAGNIALNNKVYVFHQKELANQSSFEVKEETTQGNEDPFFTQYMLK